MQLDELLEDDGDGLPVVDDDGDGDVDVVVLDDGDGDVEVVTFGVKNVTLLALTALSVASATSMLLVLLGLQTIDNVPRPAVAEANGTVTLSAELPPSGLVSAVGTVTFTAGEIAVAPRWMLQVTSTSEEPLFTSSTEPVTAAGQRRLRAATRALAPSGVT